VIVELPLQFDLPAVRFLYNFVLFVHTSRLVSPLS